jgi:hypothetical protein
MPFHLEAAEPVRRPIPVAARVVVLPVWCRCSCCSGRPAIARCRRCSASAGRRQCQCSCAAETRRAGVHLPDLGVHRRATGPVWVVGRDRDRDAGHWRRVLRVSNPSQPNTVTQIRYSSRNSTARDPAMITERHETPGHLTCDEFGTRTGCFGRSDHGTGGGSVRGGPGTDRRSVTADAAVCIAP